MRKITYDEWGAEGIHRFGPDVMAWRFVCPCCGHVASTSDWKDAGAPSGAVAYSCVGRWSGQKRDAFGGSGDGPCNYAGGGLFSVSPVIVSDHNDTAYFEFAEVA